MTISWANLRSFNGSQNIAFEELCCQLARYEDVPDNSEYFRLGTPDGGVECYWRLPDGSEIAWQAKFFLNTPKKNQWKQIEKSIKRSLQTHPNIKRYTICLPIDRADPRTPNKKFFMDKWNENVLKWINDAKTLGKSVTFEYWGESEIWERLSLDKHLGRFYFWFNKEYFSYEWYKQQIEETITNVGPRYTPELNIDLPISKNFEALGRTKNFFKNIKEIHSNLKKFYEKNGNSPIFITSVNDSKIHLLKQSISKIIKSLELVKESMEENFDFSSIFKLARQSIEIGGDFRYNLKILQYEWRRRKKYSDTSKINRWHSSLVELHKLLMTIYNLEENKTIELANKSIFFLTGNAGVGKTHLLCDIAKFRIKNKLPTILLLGEHFKDENPWLQILKLLNLNCSRDEFLHALEANTELLGVKVLIFIDALNEGDGIILWHKYLPGMIKILSKYPYIGLCMSIRTGYEQLVIPDQLINDGINIIEHQGFEYPGYSIISKFFDYYNLETPSIPLLMPEFKNPLFLKIFCIGLKNQDLSRIPRGHLGLIKIFDGYIDSIYSKLYRPEYLNSDPQTNYIKKAINSLSKLMASRKSRCINREEAYAEINNILPSPTYEKSLFRYMISESIIIESYFYDGNDQIPCIRFSYERFTDFNIAHYLLENYFNKLNPSQSFEQGSFLGDIINDNFSQNKFRGIIDAFSIIIPEKYNLELIELLPKDIESHIFLKSFIESIIWRKPESIPDRIIPHLNRIFLEQEYLYDDFLHSLLLVGAIPEHKLNANFLHNYLIKLNLSERDRKWTNLLNFNHNLNGLVEEIIKWVWNTTSKVDLNDNSIQLYGTILTWFFSLSNQDLRDSSTKALVAIMSHNVNGLNGLLEKFIHVDDPYVLERLYASIYGICIRCNNDSLLGEIAQNIYNLTFKDKEPFPNILLRDYARCTIEYALSRNLTLEINYDDFRPPYNSSWSHDDLDIETSSYWNEDGLTEPLLKEYDYLKFSIFEWDFARYIIGTNSNNFPWSAIPLNDSYEPVEFSNTDLFDLTIFQKWILKRVLDLGWTPQKFGGHDSMVRSLSHIYGSIERIGKKYQWIAYFELLSYISDNFKFFDDKTYLQKIGKYEGTWQLDHCRNVDPSCLLKEHEENLESRQKKIWYCPFLNNKWEVNMDDNEWIRSIKDIPDFKENIETKNNEDNSKWLNLEGFYRWRDKKIKDVISDNLSTKDIWIKLRSYIVKKDDFDTLFQWIKEKNFMENMMPSNDYPENVFLGEYYWSPAFNDKNITWFGRGEWEDIGDENISWKILPTADKYHNSSSKDSSIIGISIELFLLHDWLVKNMKLRWNVENYEYIDENHNKVAFNPLYNFESPQIILIKKEELLKFLDNNNLTIFWILYGQKKIIRNSFVEREPARYDINGIYTLKKRKIQGNINIFETYHPKLFTNFKNETSKNAIWKNKITKQFKMWYRKKYLTN